ncbi:MAG: TraX family protein [Clostridia bacterium]|nr:TraX family protein [Clostridia bacterium]
MSSFVLKLIALIAMTFDHLGYAIYNSSSWMNYVGRIAFPIFAWQITIGFEKTRNVKMYIFKLFAAAMISQPIYMLFLSRITENIYSLNILFTLCLGLICLYVWKKSNLLGILAIFIACIIANYCQFDYGYYGIIMIVIFYIFRNNNPLMILMQLVNLLVYYVNTFNEIQLCSIIAFCVILLYNGRRGKRIQYLFYGFYPLHLLAIYLIDKYFLV